MTADSVAAGGPLADVAVVLVATDERMLLVAAVASLLRSTAAGVAMEIVVVDNASSDGVGAEVSRRWPDVRVIRRHRRHGPSANLNAGILATRAPFVMICNSDIEFGAGAVGCLLQFLESHPQAAMAAPALLSAAGETWPSARRWYTWRALSVLRAPWVRNPETFPSVRDHLYLDWDHVDAKQVDWVLCAATMYPPERPRGLRLDGRALPHLLRRR